MIGEEVVNTLECESGHVYCVRDTSKYSTSKMITIVGYLDPAPIDLTSVTDLDVFSRVAVEVEREN